MVLCAGFGAALALQSTHTSFDQRLSVRITRDHRVLTLLVVNVGMLQDKANILDFFFGGGTKKEFIEFTAPNLAVHLTAAYIYM